MAPRGKNTTTNPSKGKARATREDILRPPDPGSDSDFEPDPEHASEPGEESSQEGPSTTEPPNFRTIPCVPCLKRMIKVPLNGRPEPCISREGNFTACKFCAVKSLGCKSPGDYVEQPLIKQWNDRKRKKVVKGFTDSALDVQTAAQNILKGEEVEGDWEELTKEAQRFIDVVEAEKAKQEAHEAKKKYEALREEVDSIWAKLKDIENKAKLFLPQDLDDQMFVRFMACAMLLEEADRDKFQKTLDHIRGVSEAGDDGTDDDTVDEEEDEERESLSGGNNDDVSMVSE